MVVPLPVVVLGRNPNVFKVVNEAYKPIFQVIHFCSSTEEGIIDLPLILKCRTPPTSAENLGTKDYSKPPVAFIAGGGYKDADVVVLRDAILKAAGPDAAKVPWLRPDPNKVTPPYGPEYAAQAGRDSRKRLEEVVVDGAGKDGGEFFY